MSELVIQRTASGRPMYQYLDKPHLSMLRGRWVCGNKHRCVTGRTKPVFAYRAWERDIKSLRRLGGRIGKGY